MLDALQRMRTPFADTVMVLVTRLGDNGAVWIVIAIVLLCVNRYRRSGVAVALTLVADEIGNNLILKNIFRRPRPCDLALADMLIARPGGWSMPSGHTAVAFAAAFALFAANRTWGICAFMLALCIGFSRLYLYVHFPTDVIAGAVCGLCFGWMGVTLERWMAQKRLRS